MSAENLVLRREIEIAAEMVSGAPRQNAPTIARPFLEEMITDLQDKVGPHLATIGSVRAIGQSYEDAAENLSMADMVLLLKTLEGKFFANLSSVEMMSYSSEREIMTAIKADAITARVGNINSANLVREGLEGDDWSPFY